MGKGQKTFWREVIWVGGEIVNNFTRVFLHETSFYLEAAKKNVTEAVAVKYLHLYLPEICAVVGSFGCSSSLVMPFWIPKLIMCFHLGKVIDLHKSCRRKAEFVSSPVAANGCLIWKGSVKNLRPHMLVFPFPVSGAEAPGVPWGGLSHCTLILFSACLLLHVARGFCIVRLWLPSTGRSVFNQSEMGSVSEIRN